MQTDRASKLQPPYDRNLPPEYWQELKTPDRYAQYRAQHPLQKPPGKINVPIVCAVSVLGVALCVAILASQHASSPKPEPVAVATPAPTLVPSPTPSPVPVQTVPRALPVTGPMTLAGTPMLSGNQYYVHMPDGRSILVNYKGWVDHACNLPRQHGINNAAYTDQATGTTWIWTVPVGASNLPRWIDP